MGLEEGQDPVWISRETEMWAPEYFLRARASTGPTWFSAGTVYGFMHVSRGLNKHRTSLGQRRDLDVGSVVVFRGLKKHRFQLGSIQGHIYAVRSVLRVLPKGRTHPDSVHGPRGGPRSIFRKPGQQMCAEDCLLEA